MMKKSIHAKVVDQSFEDLDLLAARAAEEDEILDIEDDVAEDEDEDDDSDIETESDEDGDEDESEEEYEDDSDSDDDSDEDSDDGDEDADDGDEEFSEDDDTDTDTDSDEYEDGEAEGEEEEIEFEDDSDDSDSDEDGDEEEFVTEDDSDEADACDDEDEARAREEEVIAQLQAEGLACVVGSAAAISARELGVAIASLEEDEFGDDEEDADDESDEEIEVDADEDEDLVEEDEDMDSDSDEDGDEEEFVTEDDDSDEAEGEDEFEEEVEVDADEDEDGDEDVEVDADEEEELDEDRLAPVATEEFLASASVSDVDLVLHADSRNPVWNVIVAGVPAARIALSSFGSGASEIAKFFVTPEYASGLKRAMASEGVAGLLKKSNAEFYANAYKSSSLFAEASASAEEVANQKVTSALAGLREDFIDALKIVSAGLDKNFFANKPNHLKRALFMNLAEAGVQNPAQIIEASFRENGKHFEIIAEMATDLLDKPQDVRDTLRQSIDEAGLIERTAPAPASASVIATANTGLALAKSFAATASTEVRTGKLEGSVAERKDSLRGLFA